MNFFVVIVTTKNVAFFDITSKIRKNRCAQNRAHPTSYERSLGSVFRFKISRENPRSSVIGIRIKAIRIGIIITNALSMPVNKTKRDAPGNNINHPARHSPNDHGHNILRTLCNSEGNLPHVLCDVFLIKEIKTAIVPRMGGPKPPPARSIKIKRANNAILAFLPGLGFTNTTRKLNEKIMDITPVIK